MLSDALPPIDETVCSPTQPAASTTSRRSAPRSTAPQRTAEALGRFLDTYRGYTRTVLRRASGGSSPAEADRARSARRSRQAERDLADAETLVDDADGTLRRLRRRARRRPTTSGGHSNAATHIAPTRTSSIDRRGSTPWTSRPERRSRRPSAPRRLTTERRRMSPSAVADLRRSVAATDDRRRRRRRRWPSAPGSAPACWAGNRRSTPPGSPPPPSGPAALGCSPSSGSAERARSAPSPCAPNGRSPTPSPPTSGPPSPRARSSASGHRGRGTGGTRRGGERLDGRGREWTAGTFAAGCGADWTPALAALERRDEPATWTTDVRGAVIEALAPVLSRARDAAATADAEVAAAVAARSETEERLRALEAETEARPTPSRFCDAARDPAAGAPLYELVDVRPGVDERAAAGVEAALEACGLLDAWVAADGVVVHPRTHDTIVRPDLPIRPAAATRSPPFCGRPSESMGAVPAGDGAHRARGHWPRRAARRRGVGGHGWAVVGRGPARRLGEARRRVPRCRGAPADPPAAAGGAACRAGDPRRGGGHVAGRRGRRGQPSRRRRRAARHAAVGDRRRCRHRGGRCRRALCRRRPRAARP